MRFIAICALLLSINSFADSPLFTCKSNDGQVEVKLYETWVLFEETAILKIGSEAINMDCGSSINGPFICKDENKIFTLTLKDNVALLVSKFGTTSLPCKAAY